MKKYTQILAILFTLSCCYAENSKKDLFLTNIESKIFILNVDKKKDTFFLGTNKFSVPSVVYDGSLLDVLTNFTPNKITLKGIESDFAWGNIFLWGGLAVSELGVGVAGFSLIYATSSTPLPQGVSIGMAVSGIAAYIIGIVAIIPGSALIAKGRGKILKAVHEYNKNIIGNEFLINLGVTVNTNPNYIFGFNFVNYSF